MEPSRILIVEDEAIVALDLEDRLVGMGYQVVGRAATGEQAVDLARRTSPDLLLMDIRLQGPMDGIAAAVEIRRHRRIPVIFVSAYADGTTLERAKHAEPFGFVVKPFDDRELHSAIEVAMYRARSEDKILRLTRLYAVLSQINQAVVRITDSGELFAAVCRIVVEYGDVDLAWVGRLDEEAKRIVPLARFGRHHAYLDAAFEETGDERKRLVSTHKAIEEGRPIVCADYGSEGICDALPSKAPHAFGYRSCLSVPLIAQGWGHGALCVMATEPSFFGQQEIDLFKEVALDVSFALDHLAKEDERHRANEALEAELTRRRVLIEGSRDGIVVLDQNGKAFECNPRFAEMLGYSTDDVLTMHA